MRLTNNPGNAKVEGSLTSRFYNGEATFSPLSLNKSGMGFVLEASTSSLEPTSTTFDVVDQVVITTAPPESVAVDSPFTFIAKLKDILGNVVTTFNGMLTIDLSNFAGASSSGLVGKVAVNAINGVATFRNLSINQAGDFTITVHSATSTAASSLFHVASSQASFEFGD